jgi:hypothetical protein
LGNYFVVFIVVPAVVTALAENIVFIISGNLDNKVIATNIWIACTSQNTLSVSAVYQPAVAVD